jgi:ABC-type branched-subunit amino acid transport system substrate-binding protein
MIIFLIEFLLSRLLFCSSNLTPPSEVRVGGLFPLFRTSGPAITTGQQRLAGFLLAVKEINEDTTILPNTTFKIVVKDTKLNLGKTFFAALEMSKLAFNGKGVDACIGAQASGESDAAATVLSQYGTVQISYSSTSPLLSNKVNYRYFARTCPSDSFQGTAMASMVADYFGWYDFFSYSS